VVSAGIGSLFWATTAAVLADILAPVHNESPRGIVLNGAGATAVGQAVAESLGCVIHSVSDAKSARIALEVEQRHRWPVIFRIEPTVQQRHRKLLLEGMDDLPHNCLMTLGSCNAMVKALEGSWHVIVGQEPAIAPRDALSMARRLLPAYLHDFCERGVYYSHWEHSVDSFGETVLRDLAKYVDDRGRNETQVLSALETLWPSCESGHARAFAELLARFIRNGSLMVGDEGNAKRGPVLTRLPDVEGLLVPRAIFAKLLRIEHVAMPDEARAATVLARAGVLIENRENGWVIPDSWLHERLQSVNTATADLLRVSS